MSKNVEHLTGMFKRKESRRNVIKWAVVSMAGLAPFLAPKSAWASQPTDAVRHAMLTVFKDQEAARTVGEKYLIDHVEDNDAVRLTEALFGQNPGRLSPRSLRRTLNQQRQDDFAADQYVLVDNWVLARSEARACALVALL